MEIEEEIRQLEDERSTLISEQDWERLVAIDARLDELDQQAARLAGQTYVPRFRIFERLQPQKLNALADAVRELLSRRG